jgi:hypothetical protein
MAMTRTGTEFCAGWVGIAQNVGTGRCMDIVNTEGAPVMSVSCNGGLTQRINVPGTGPYAMYAHAPIFHPGIITESGVTH